MAADPELPLPSLEEVVESLDPEVKAGLQEIWERTTKLDGNWAEELISDRREQQTEIERRAE